MSKARQPQSQIPTESKLVALCEQGQYDQLESIFDAFPAPDRAVLDNCFLATCRAHNYLGDYENILLLLLNKGASVNAKDKATERTGLTIAVQANNLGLARLLLENKADANVIDKEGKSALVHAVLLETGENADVVNLLLDFKAVPETRAKDGSTPLSIALKRSFDKVSVALIKKCTDFSFKEKSTGNSYLHIAAYRNIEPAVRSLLKRGMVNADNLNNDCKLPSDLTISDGILECLCGTPKRLDDKGKPKPAVNAKKPVKKKNSEKIDLNKIDQPKPKQRVSLKSTKEVNMKCATAVQKEPKKALVNSVTKSKARPDIESK